MRWRDWPLKRFVLVWSYGRYRGARQAALGSSSSPLRSSSAWLNKREGCLAQSLTGYALAAIAR